MIDEFLNLRPVDETALFPTSFHIELPDDSDAEMPNWEPCGLITYQADKGGYINLVMASLGGGFFNKLEAGYDDSYLRLVYTQVAKTLSILISIETQIPLTEKFTVNFSNDQDALVFSQTYKSAEILGSQNIR